MNVKSLCIVFLIIIICLFNSCIKNKTAQDFTEGIIEYDIHYYENADNNPLIELLPTTLELRVKNHLSSSKVEGWMGIFKSVYITNSKKGTNSTLLKILNKKYSYVASQNEPIPGYKNNENIKIEFLKGGKKILGFRCKKAVVTIPNHEFNPIVVYYTNEFNISNAFLSNLFFNKIPGFLFEFPLEMNGIQMQLKIKSIIPCSIDDNEFEIPDEFEKVTREKMQEIIDSLI